MGHYKGRDNLRVRRRRHLKNEQKRARGKKRLKFVPGDTFPYSEDSAIAAIQRKTRVAVWELGEV